MRISRANVETAATLGHTRYDPEGEAKVNIPEGWTYLGSGSSRTAYLGPDGLVYKVSRDRDCYQSRAEGSAAWTWRKRTDLPEWVVIPRAHFVEDAKVLVMEYFGKNQPKCRYWDNKCVCGKPVEGKCWWSALISLGKCGMVDIQTANSVLMDDGRIAIVDLGCEGEDDES